MTDDINTHAAEFDLDDIDPDHFSGAFEVPLVQPLGITIIGSRGLVLVKYPLARWVTSGDIGRIVAGDVLVSLAIPLADPEAESRAWADAAGRLGNGNQWKASRAAGHPDRPGRLTTGGQDSNG